MIVQAKAEACLETETENFSKVKSEGAELAGKLENAKQVRANLAIAFERERTANQKVFTQICNQWAVHEKCCERSLPERH